jgi:hypothetical protein
LMTSLPVTHFPAPPMPAGPLPRPRASVPTHTQARKHASTCSDNLSEIPVGVDPMNFTVRRPAEPAAFRMLVGVFGGGKWLKEKSLCISKGMDYAFGKSLEKYRENTDLLLETIKRSGYWNMSIIYVAYLDSIGWNFDGRLRVGNCCTAWIPHLQRPFQHTTKSCVHPGNRGRGAKT